MKCIVHYIWKKNNCVSGTKLVTGQTLPKMLLLTFLLDLKKKKKTKFALSLVTPSLASLVTLISSLDSKTRGKKP